MNKLLIFHQTDEKIEEMQLEDSQSMPYVSGNKLSVGNFKTGSASPILWTTRETLAKIDQTFEGPFAPIAGFCRVYEFPHKSYRHYTGEAIDIFGTPVSKDMPPWDQHLLFSNRLHLQMGNTQPFLPVAIGSRGTTVMVMQDMLNILGYIPDNIDGIFGSKTHAALRSFQRKSQLKDSGVCDMNTWQFLFQKTIDNKSLVE